MDYCLINALSYNMMGLYCMWLFYDINCSYMWKLFQQINSNHMIDIPVDIEIISGIGIWYVHGHQPQCFAWYAPLFIPGIGWIDGEIIETLWSILNTISASTHDVCTTLPRATWLSNERFKLYENDPHGWGQYFSISWSSISPFIQGKHLSTKLGTAQTALKSTTAAFKKLDDGVPLEYKEQWLDEERQALN